MTLSTVPTHPPGMPEFIQLVRLYPVRVTPPFEENLLLRLREGHLIVAQISHRSPDDPDDRPGLIARQVSSGQAAFGDARFFLYPGWGEDASAALFFSNEITHWGDLDPNHRRTIQ